MCSCLTLIPAHVAMTEALDKKKYGGLDEVWSSQQEDRSFPPAPFTMKKSLKCSPCCSFGVHLAVCPKKRVLTAGDGFVPFKYIS